ncbi:MAG: hypothetical protein EAX95_12305 [Candidatus Thorarchaeota archaeon]|nr:hypothetical protein [Candidatus Thorarchaeota archaeon]
MKKEVIGKKVVSWHLNGVEKLQKSKMVNPDVKAFDGLHSRTCEDVVARGNMIRVKFDKKQNLLLAPEYGGEILVHESGAILPQQRHLKLELDDGSCLTVRLKGWGAIYCLKDDELQSMYTYARDFSDTLSPYESAFTLDRFSNLLLDYTANIKMALVGKDAVVVGFQNSAFQDLLYRAGIHPKRRAADLSSQEVDALYTSILALLDERRSKGGKTQFVDLYGKKGGYEPVMGPNMKNKNCPKCQTKVVNVSHGGGQVYFCPTCQR